MDLSAPGDYRVYLREEGEYVPASWTSPAEYPMIVFDHLTGDHDETVEPDKHLRRIVDCIVDSLSDFSTADNWQAQLPEYGFHVCEDCAVIMLESDLAPYPVCRSCSHDHTITEKPGGNRASHAAEAA